MDEKAHEQEATDVPSLIFGQFLESLTAAGQPEDVVARLRKTLLEDKLFTERVLRAAMFGEEAPK